MKSLPSLLLAALCVLSISGGCARVELNRAEKARAAYQACLDEHPRETSRCDELRAAMNREYDRYESVARERSRVWRDDEVPPSR